MKKCKITLLIIFLINCMLKWWYIIKYTNIIKWKYIIKIFGLLKFLNYICDSYYIFIGQGCSRSRFGSLPFTVQPSVFINKVLLENMPTHLHISYDCFPASAAELNSCSRDYMTHNPKILTIWPLRKSLLTSILEQWFLTYFNQDPQKLYI